MRCVAQRLFSVQAGRIIGRRVRRSVWHQGCRRIDEFGLRRLRRLRVRCMLNCRHLISLRQLPPLAAKVIAQGVQAFGCHRENIVTAFGVVFGQALQVIVHTGDHVRQGVQCYPVRHGLGA